MPAARGTRPPRAITNRAHTATSAPECLGASPWGPLPYVYGNEVPGGKVPGHTYLDQVIAQGGQVRIAGCSAVSSSLGGTRGRLVRTPGEYLGTFRMIFIPASGAVSTTRA